MLKYLIICFLMLLAPGLTMAKAPVKCAKGDKACEKKKAKAKKSAKKAAKKSIKKTAKAGKKDAKKAGKKAMKTAGKKHDKKAKKKVTEEAMMAPFDGGEATPDTPTPTDVGLGESTAAVPPSDGADTFSDPAAANHAPRDPGSSEGLPSDGIGSEADFELGDELPAE